MVINGLIFYIHSHNFNLFIIIIMNTFFDKIDKIVYINLDSRPDRKEKMILQFNKFNIPEHKIIRFNAIKHKFGMIGCSLSHIEVLRIALTNDWSNVLILEDDFNFIDNNTLINDVINNFFDTFQNNWDVLNLTRGYYQNFTNIGIKYFQKINDVSSAAGYLVNRHMYDNILDNMITGCDMLIKTKNDTLYCVDRYWTNLLKTARWYITVPSLGYQRSDYSDISKMNVDYTILDKTLHSNIT